MADLLQLQRANLYDLQALFLHRSEGPKALDLMASHPGHLSELLRHHSELGIHDPLEVELRNAFDDALGFCGLLEIAVQAGYVGPEFPSDVSGPLRGLLEHREVRKYYEFLYPLPLPLCLRLRLIGHDCAVPASNASRQVRLFQDFLAVELALRESTPCMHFLALLDDYRVEHYSFASLEAVFRRPDEYLARCFRNPQNRDSLDEALEGFVTTTRLWLRLLDIIESAAEFPLLQSSFWQHHAYWFRRAQDQTEKRIVSLMHALLTWPLLDVQLNPTDREDQRRDLEAIERDTQRLGALFSGRLGDPLVQYISGLTNDPEYGRLLEQDVTQTLRESARASTYTSWTTAVHNLLKERGFERHQASLIRAAELALAEYLALLDYSRAAPRAPARRQEISVAEWKKRIGELYRRSKG